MFGTNPVRGAVRDGGAALWVQEVFPTLQGEGPLVGQPAVFVRLAGCNLRCFWCDTEFESSDWRPSVEALVERIEAVRGPGCDLVVLTGGEPLRQDVGTFISTLLEAGWRVQIETAGTLWVELPDDRRLTVVCSPKTPGLNPRLEARIDAYKYVIGADEVCPDDGLPVLSTQRPGVASRVARPRAGVPVYVMPRDDGDPARNTANLQTAVQVALSHGHRLGIQMHKLIDVP
ncbi:MAG: 7-carboxy-7-deazaguanine synthase [Myxococcota bacterium]|jgi:7-carboxy-7-deazaguanine synthase